MNRIEKLITELCPNGVEYRKLGEVCDSLKKGTLTVNELLPNGKYPVINLGRDIYGYYDKYNNEGNAITIAARGEYSGFINYISAKFWAGGLCYPYTSNNEKIILTKFIYYTLKTLEKYIRNYLVTEGSIPALNKTDINNLSIPVPPLPIQEEIVRILDKFTELEAELEARKKQYEYYRNKLLTPVEVGGRWLLNGKEVEWKKLGEIGTLIRGNGLQKKDFVNEGVGCIHYGQIYTYYGTFANKTISFVKPDVAKNLVKVNKNDLIITNTSENIEDVCKSVAWLGENQIVTGGHATVLKHQQNPKYLSYFLQIPYFFNQKKKYAKGTKVIEVYVKDLANILIPIPSLSEQERIVAILDKFDALVNDISQGLPAEIEACRKQYEYYRNKVLAFEKLNK